MPDARSLAVLLFLVAALAQCDVADPEAGGPEDGVEDYWTDERMDGARPADIGVDGG